MNEREDADRSIMIDVKRSVTNRINPVLESFFFCKALICKKATGRGTKFVNMHTKNVCEVTGVSIGPQRCTIPKKVTCPYYLGESQDEDIGHQRRG
jgi:hypothetical protein